MKERIGKIDWWVFFTGFLIGAFLLGPLLMKILYGSP